MQDIKKLNFNPKENRPLLRPSSSSKELSLSKPYADLKPLPNYTGNIYKIRTGPVLHDPKYISKVCPRKIPTDKERLYEENINLKQMYNYINEENTRLRTKVNQLEKLSDSNKIPDVLSSPNVKTSHLMESLKLNIKDLKCELKAKDKEIEDMRKYMRYTKVQELEGDVLQFTSECIRLKEIIDYLVQEKGIEQDGSLGDVKSDNDRLRKELSKIKEEEKLKNEAIQELQKQIELKTGEKSKWDSKWEKQIQELDKENERLKEQIKEMQLIIEELHRKSMLNQLGKDSEQVSDVFSVNEVEEKQGGQAEVQKFCEKFEAFLLKNRITSAEWIKSVTKNQIISKTELLNAMLQDEIATNLLEIDSFLQKYGENDDQVLSKVFIEVFDKVTENNLTIDELFEGFKAKATLMGIKSPGRYAEDALTDYEISESDIKHLCSQGLFYIEDPSSLQELNKFFFKEIYPISKEKCIEMIETKFKGWTPLNRTELDGMIRRFQGLLFECYEDIVCRLQETNQGSSTVPIFKFLQELKVYDIVHTDAEECCARALALFYSKSVKLIEYMEILRVLYEYDIHKEIFSNVELDFSSDALNRSVKITETNQTAELEGQEEFEDDFENDS